MSKERYNQIIDEVYGKYADSHFIPPSNPKGKLLSDQLFRVIPMENSKESFINKIKTDAKFSKKWGLKIEERVLSLGERNQIGNFDYTMCDDSLIYPTMEDDRKKYKELFDKENIPTKVLTLTYKNETIESYEN